MTDDLGPQRRFPLYWRAEGLRPLERVVWLLQLALPFGGHPLNRGESLRPFFIIGASRSGTTLLRRILTSHPDLHIPPETYVLGEAIKWYYRLRRARWDALVNVVLSRLEYDRRFAPWGVSLRPVAIALHPLPEKERSLARILDAVFRLHAEQAGKGLATWGDKTPLNTYHLDKIAAVFPGARYVHLVRHGCDCVDSYLRNGFLPDIETGAWRWASAIDAGQRFARRWPERCLELRYEELVADPEPTVRRVTDFLQVTFAREMLASEATVATMGDVLDAPQHARVGEPITATAVGCGRAAFSRSELRQIQAIIGSRLAALGYEACERK